MSRLPRPRRECPRARKFSTQACWCLGVVAVAQRVRLLAAGAADGVVAPHVVAVTVISGRPSLDSSSVPGDEEDVALGDDRVGRAVALGRVVGVVEQAVDGLVALEVDDAQRAAGARRRATTGARASTTSSSTTHRSCRTRPSSVSRYSSVFRNARSRLRASTTTPGRRASVGGSPPGGDAQRRRPCTSGRGSSRCGRVGDEDDHRHLGAQLDVRAGLRAVAVERQRAVGARRARP